LLGLCSSGTKQRKQICSTPNSWKFGYFLGSKELFGLFVSALFRSA